MAQNINDPFYRGAGGQIGQEFGQNFANLLGGMAQQKAREINQNKLKATYGSLGLPQQLAMLPDQQQQIALKEILGEYGLGGFPNGQPQGQNPLMQPAGQQQNPMQQLLMQQPQQGMQFPMMQPGMGRRAQERAFNQQMQLENLNARKQQNITARNAAWNKGTTKAYDTAVSVREMLEKMDSLVKGGHVASGITGRLTPGSFQNADTQEFESLTNQLVGLLTSQFGVPTEGKIAFIQSQKPTTSQSTKAQLRIIDRLLKETERPLLMGQLRDQLILSNENQEPENLEQMTRQYYNQYKSMMHDQGEQEQRPEQQQGYDAENEGPGGMIARNILRGAGNVVAGGLGGLGDIGAAGLGAANWLTGGRTPTYSQAQEYLPLPPTSQNIADTLGKMSGGYLSAQSGTNEVMDDIARTVGSLWLPGQIIGKAGQILTKGATALASKAGLSAAQAAQLTKVAEKAPMIALPFSGIMPLKTAVKMAVGGEAAGKTVEALGGGPVFSGLAKAGFMIGYGIKGTRDELKALQHTVYDSANENFKNIKMDATNMQQALKELQEDVARSASPHKDKFNAIVKQFDDALYEAAAQGERVGHRPYITLDKFANFNKDYNEWMQLADREIFAGQRHLPEKIKAKIHAIGEKAKEPFTNPKALGTDFYEHSKSKAYEEGIKDWAIGQDLTKGFSDLDAATRMLQEDVTLKKYLTEGNVSNTFSGTAMKMLAFPALKLAREGRLFLNLINKSAHARTEYIKAVEAAAHGHKKAFIEHLARLDKIGYAEHKKNKEGRD
jgi:hypothetical protein